MESTDHSPLFDSEDLRERFAYQQALLTALPEGIAVFDAEQRLKVWNANFLKLLELPASLVQDGVLFSQLMRLPAERGEFGPGDPEVIVLSLLARKRRDEPHQVERVRPNGRTLEIRSTPLPGGGFVLVYADTTERRLSAGREQLVQKVFDHTPTGIVVTDDAYRILSSNPAATQMTGYEPFELHGHSILAFFEQAREVVAELQGEQMGVRGVWNGELEVTRKSGENFSAGVRVSRVDDMHSGLPANYIWIMADITERKEAEERMRHIAQHDPLTGLPNRLSLQIRLAQVLPDARRYQRTLAVMFLDLDRFKVINDTLGHQVGDELLREVAVRLSRVVRETDFVARLGGDEFVILLPAITMPADAAVVASKIIASLAAPIQVDNNELHTSPSIGISLFPVDGPDGDTILKHADTAMYHAKATGRNNYQFYAPEMNAVATERMEIERKLRHALVRNELALCFHPQFDAKTGRATGVEALVRWHHPVDGVISPDRFIPVAEETGIIVPLGEWVLAAACREMIQWMESGLPPLRMAVNVSARQLRRRDFCETVAGILAETGLPPEQLELEITESSVMENPEEAIEVLNRLVNMGVSLAIDDFGTGYSSLAYLKLFPIDHLKIDRSFVRDIEFDLNDRSIAFGTIALAHSLGLNVIAEGVESEDQLDLLSSNGCDEVQGYYFSKPLPGPAAFAFLHARCAAE